MTVIPNLAHADYLAHPALSVSGMKMLLPPSCPALYRYWTDHRRPSKPAFDKGHVVHSLVLGDGPEMVVINAEDWRTKAAREERDAAYAAGQVPILSADYMEAQAMAGAVRSNRLADMLLSHGKPEQSLMWEQHGVQMRARVDWLPDMRDLPSDAKFIAVDLKTTGKSAHPSVFAKAAADYGYYMQAAQYIAGIKACGLDDDPAFVLVVVETSPPHLVTLCEFTEYDLQIGREKIAEAAAIFKQCTETGVWPGYSEQIETIELPEWFRRQHERDTEEEMVI